MKSEQFSQQKLQSLGDGPVWALCLSVVTGTRGQLGQGVEDPPQTPQVLSSAPPSHLLGT